MGSVALLQSLKESILGQASVKTIYGEPISAHGKTIIPVAKIMYGYGAGAGNGGVGDTRAPGEGGGGGGGGGGVGGGREGGGGGWGGGGVCAAFFLFVFYRGERTADPVRSDY